MKRFILFSLIGIYFSSVLLSQEPVRFGIVGGMNVSKTSSSFFSSRIGFHIGAKAEINLSKSVNGLYFEPEALLSLKGGKVDWGNLGSMSTNPYYLEIPLRIGYKYAVNDNFKLIGKAGPYLAYGLFGKEIDDYGPDGTEKSDLFTGDYAMNRFDVGIGLSLGFEIQNKFQLFIGNDWGLVPLYETTYSEDEYDLGSGAKNINLTISMAFLF